MKVYILGRKTIIILFGVMMIMVLGLIVTSWHTDDVVQVARSKKDLPIYSVETETPQISISFDAAWGADDTDNILAALERNGVKATFFLVSNWIEEYPEVVKKIHELGHDIANHSNTHPHMDRLNRKEIKEEVMGPHELVKDLLGIEMELFRPPYGAFNDAVVDVARECGYYTIKWNIDSLDWKDYGPKDMFKRVVESEYLENGAIILFHNNTKYTAESLDDIIKGLQDKGFQLVPISQLIMREDYYMNKIGRQCRTEEAKKRDNELRNPLERSCDEEETKEE